MQYWFKRRLSFLFPRRQPRWRVGCSTSLQSVPRTPLCPWLMVCLDSFSTSWWSSPETVWTSPRMAWWPPGTSWSCRRNWRSCCMRWVSLIFSKWFFIFFIQRIFFLFFSFSNSQGVLVLSKMFLAGVIVGSSGCPLGHCMLYYSSTEDTEHWNEKAHFLC